MTPKALMEYEWFDAVFAVFDPIDPEASVEFFDMRRL